MDPLGVYKPLTVTRETWQGSTAIVMYMCIRTPCAYRVITPRKNHNIVQINVIDTASP